MRRRKRPPTRNHYRATIAGIYQVIDYWSAILLLTGQVTSTGVFISPGGFWVSVTGPILGGTRLAGKDIVSGAALDAVDIITAFLLILGQLTVTGPWITSGRFNLVISGPAFGIPTVPIPEVPFETTNEFFQQFRNLLVTRFLNEST